QNQDQEEAVGMVRAKDAGGMPMPAVRLEVTERRLLPVAPGIQPAISGLGRWGVGDEEPGVLVAGLPNDVEGSTQPAGFLEDLALRTPMLTRRIRQMLQGTLLAVQADFT